jgi:predicted DNA-binding protein with PD1-like motif
VTATVSQNIQQHGIPILLRRGDELCSTLAGHVGRLGLQGAALVAAVGSYSEVAYSLPGLREDGSVTYVEVRRASGLFSIVSLSGHFGRDDDGNVHPHLHTSFAGEDGVVLGGHLFAGIVLATAEITLLPGRPWRATLGPQVEDEQAWVLAPLEE